MNENEVTVEWGGQSYNLNEWLLMVPVIYEGEKEGEKLAEPDNYLHFSAGASEGLQKGMKVLFLDDLYQKYQPANITTNNGVMHLRTIINRASNLEMIPVCLHLGLFEDMFEPKHLGVFTLKEIMDLSLEYGCLVIDPGFINKPVFSRKAETLTREKTKEERQFELFKDKMTGTLVANYKKSHNNEYSEEYVRRLVSIGFTEPQANNLFMFELMILKSISTDSLAASDYIYKYAIPINVPVLPESDEWYVEHQMFLISELVKIWDEAEYIWRQQRDQLTDETRRKRIYSITRYGGGNLFLSYLNMVSEKAHTSMELLQKYTKAEQDLLYIYRWKVQDIPHPYLPEEKELDKTPVYITLNNYGDDKITAIKYIRIITGASLPEAIEICKYLPIKLKKSVPMYKAQEYADELKEKNIDATITPAKDNEQDSDILFNIILTITSKDKIHAIRLIREITGASVSEAKELTERSPINLNVALPMNKIKEYEAELKEIGSFDLIPLWKSEQEAESKTDKLVYLKFISCGDSKLRGIKYLREIMGLSLPEAVKIVERTPVKLEKPFPNQVAEEYVQKLKQCNNFQVEIIPADGEE